MRRIWLGLMATVALTTACQAPVTKPSAPSPAASSPVSGDDAFLETLAKQPGAETSVHTAPDGTVIKKIRLPSGVAFIRRQQGDKVSIRDLDESGHGAVLCAWAFQIEVAAILEACGTERDGLVRQALIESIDKIGDFIVANSLTPVTKAQVQARVERIFAARRQERASRSDEQARRFCGSRANLELFDAYRSLTPEALRADVHKLLSVPRPPVMNPCL